jgi:hypothetical protein
MRQLGNFFLRRFGLSAIASIWAKKGRNVWHVLTGLAARGTTSEIPRGISGVTRVGTDGGPWAIQTVPPILVRIKLK